MTKDELGCNWFRLGRRVYYYCGQCMARRFWIEFGLDGLELLHVWYMDSFLALGSVIIVRSEDHVNNDKYVSIADCV